MPKNTAVIKVAGEARVPDPTITSGPLNLASKRFEDGTYLLYLILGWGSAFSYAERGYGSVIDHPSLYAWTTHDMMFGQAKDDISKVTEKLLKASRANTARGKGGSLSNVSKLTDLGKRMVEIIHRMINPTGTLNWGELDVPLETWLKFIIKMKSRYRKLIKRSLPEDDFEFAPVGLRVQGKTPDGGYFPATETIYDDGSKNPPRWVYDMPDHALDEPKFKRSMAGIWFILRGIFDEQLDEYDSIVLSMMFEKFRRQPLQLETANITGMLYHYMPYILRPGLLDLVDTREIARAIAYAILITMMCNRFSEVGLSTLVHDVHWTSVRIENQPDIELIQTWNYGRYRWEPEYGTGECTFIKPSRGRVDGWAIMRNSGVNRIQMKLKRNVRKINPTPAMQHRDTLYHDTTPELDILNFLGFGFRGQVIHIITEEEADKPSIFKVVDTTLVAGIDNEHRSDYNVHNLIANLLIGAQPLFKCTTGTVLTSVCIGTNGQKFEIETVDEMGDMTVDRREPDIDLVAAMLDSEDKDNTE